MGGAQPRSLPEDPGREGREVRRREGRVDRGTHASASTASSTTSALSRRTCRIEEVEGGLDGLRERRAECERAIEAREEERREVVSQLESVGTRPLASPATCGPSRSARRSSPCGSLPGPRAPPRRATAPPCSRISSVSERPSSTGFARRSTRSGSAPLPPRSAPADWRPRLASSGGPTRHFVARSRRRTIASSNGSTSGRPPRTARFTSPRR